MSGAYLPEIPESEAGGSVREVYEDIRRTLGFVNLVYRHLAVTPGRLEAVWEALRPNLTHPAADAAARELVAAAATPPVVRIPVSILAAVGIEQEELGRARATIDAYMHANPRNLLAVTVLLHPELLATGGPAGGAERPGPALAPTLLPMADLKTLSPAVIRLLEEMSAPLAAPGVALLVPGLFRHFAHNPGLLGLLWTVLRPGTEDGGISERAEEVADRARELAVRLPYPVQVVADKPTQAVLERFALTISRMIVAGAVLREALPEVPAGL